MVKNVIVCVMALTLFSSLAEAKTYKWSVDYGPFSEEVVLLNAQYFGWVQKCTPGLDGGQPVCSTNAEGVAVNEKGLTAVQFVTEVMKTKHAEILGQAKADNLASTYYQQAQTAKTTVLQETSSLITTQVSVED